MATFNADSHEERNDRKDKTDKLIFRQPFLLRCTIDDPINKSFFDIKPQYVPRGRWRKANLTYKFANFDVSLSTNELMEAFALACSIWTKYAPLTLKEVKNTTADIVVGFYDTTHHECSLCAGFGNKKNYGHGFYPSTNDQDPSLCGDIHFNKTINWTVSPHPSDEEVDFVTVAAHELGHALGLGHVSLSGALMFDSCKMPHRYLADDDIKGIKELYRNFG